VVLYPTPSQECGPMDFLMLLLVAILGLLTWGLIRLCGKV
jgi:hypothetical protein